MNKKLFNPLLLSLIIILAIGCQQNNDLTIDNEEQELKNSFDKYDYIEYGTSFGECLGYCKRRVLISSSKIAFEKKSWNLNDYPTIIITEKNDENSWKKLIGKINFNNFAGLSPVIGCPDCADGGAEWIEIKNDGNTYKTTFEYGNEPEAVKNYIQEFRALLELYNEMKME